MDLKSLINTTDCADYVDKTRETREKEGVRDRKKEIERIDLPFEKGHVVWVNIGLVFVQTGAGFHPF